MLLSRVAQAFDQAFIEFSLRQTLPTLKPDSSLARLRQAERWLLPPPVDEQLYSAIELPNGAGTRTRLQSSGLQELTLTWAAPCVPIEEIWFPQSIQSPPVRSRWFVRVTPRPLVVLVKGWTPLLGAASRWLWPLERLDRAGFDVAIALPEGCGSLGRCTANWPFPGPEPARNVLELARAAAALGQLLHLASNRGHPSILVWGTSLGAHLVALLATLSGVPPINAWVLEKPLSRLSDPVRLHGRGTTRFRNQVAARLDEIYQSVSPLDRVPRVSPQRVTVIGGEFDQVTPLSTVEVVASHFGTTPLRIPASHLVDPGRFPRIVNRVRASCTGEFAS